MRRHRPLGDEQPGCDLLVAETLGKQLGDLDCPPGEGSGFAARMCRTTGTGDARNRALPAVASAPAASGMAPSTSSPAGRSHGPIYALLVEQTRQATLRPLVIPDTLQRTLRGWCGAEMGTLAGRYRVRGPPSPFRPERIAEPRQT